MSIESLPPENAWSDGADLWVFAKEQSSFLSRVDWLLNFQISNSDRHKSPKISPETQQILEQTGLNLQDSDPAISSDSLKKNLLLSAHQFVPAKWVLIVDNESHTWTQDVFNNWSSLARPKLRVFLPKAMDFDAFKKAWKKSANEEISMTVINTSHLKSISSPSNTTETTHKGKN